MFRIITFNIRFDNPEDEDNSWIFRRDAVVRVVQRHAPALVGTQEGKWHQLMYLQEHLPAFGLHAPNRIIDDTSQYPTLFYCKERFRVKEGGEWWLSETPTIHLSKNWDSAYPRMMSYALLSDDYTNRDLMVVVTHLDHKGDYARWQQAKIIAEFTQSHNEPMIVMGDFNDRPGSSVHQLLTSPRSGLYDTWYLIGRNESEQSMTHHGFQGIPQKTRMDWILVSTHFNVLDAFIVRDSSKGHYPSDHFPYGVDVEWK